MECSLCGKPIKNYSAELNHLAIDEAHQFDICPLCIDKLVKWQGEKYAKLFPTSAIKKRFNRNRP